MDVLQVQEVVAVEWLRRLSYWSVVFRVIGQ